MKLFISFALLLAPAFASLQVMQKKVSGHKQDLLQNSTFPTVTQTVNIEGNPVCDQTSCAALNKCTAFASQHVSSPTAPTVEICGTGLKVTMYLLGPPAAHHNNDECRQYYEHQHTIDSCSAGSEVGSSTSCKSYGPADDPRIAAYQAYIIEQC